MQLLSAGAASTVLIVVALIVSLIPWVRHFTLYTKLQISLVTRLGPIWEDTEGIRTHLFGKDSFLEELNEIERKYGDQLTDEEKGWLLNSRRQKAISARWSIVVFVGLGLSLIVVYSTIGR
ncbi:MAG: hypothetical protein QNJ19_05690 [Woeseiaceae bacterium]|nr:hypothetical protein [Woeseiaceae bacterium]